MPGPQFLRIESYSRKGDKGGRTVSFVMREARREPDSSTHVLEPGQPVTIFGQDPAAIEREHDAAVEAARETNSAGRTRKIRVDQHTLLTAVASHPYLTADVKKDPLKQVEFEKWAAETVNYMKQKWGDELKGVVLHTDEAHPHIHAFIIPRDLRARDLHPGVVAKKQEFARALAAGDDSKTANRRGDRAYKTAMREFLTDYHQKVGIRSALLRDGPKRARLSRAEYLGAREAAKNLAATLEKNEALSHQIENSSQRYREAILKAKESARAWSAAAEQAKARAEAEAARLDGMPRTMAGRLARGWQVGRQVLKSVRLDNEKKERAERQSLIQRIRKAARAEARREVAGQIESLSREVARAKGQAERMGKLAEGLKGRLDKADQAGNTLREQNKKMAAELREANEKIGQVEAEREKFRGMWAESDNSKRTSPGAGRFPTLTRR
jgi:hypothetical protein